MTFLPILLVALCIALLCGLLCVVFLKKQVHRAMLYNTALERLQDQCLELKKDHPLLRSTNEDTNVHLASGKTYVMAPANAQEQSTDIEPVGTLPAGTQLRILRIEHVSPNVHTNPDVMAEAPPMRSEVTVRVENGREKGETFLLYSSDLFNKTDVGYVVESSLQEHISALEVAARTEDEASKPLDTTIPLSIRVFDSEDVRMCESGAVRLYEVVKK